MTRESILIKHYNVKPTWVELISWGYNTHAYYVSLPDSKPLLLSESQYSPSKLKRVEKDIAISTYLRKVLPTPEYFKTNSGRYLLRRNNKIYRLSEFIGLSPLQMTLSIFKQMVEILFLLHNTKPYELYVRGKSSELGNLSPIHKDPTPHNFLISHGKITSLLDFETYSLGRPEEDLGICCAYSWNYMQDTTIKEVIDCAVEVYKNPLDKNLLIFEAYRSLDKRLASIIDHKSVYKTSSEWQTDYSFISSQLLKMKAAYPAQIPDQA